MTPWCEAAGFSCGTTIAAGDAKSRARTPAALPLLGNVVPMHAAHRVLVLSVVSISNRAEPTATSVRMLAGSGLIESASHRVTPSEWYAERTI
jgi:hypothetical protein